MEEVGTGLTMEAAEVAAEFFSQEQYDRSMRQMTMIPEGPEGPTLAADAGCGNDRYQ